MQFAVISLFKDEVKKNRGIRTDGFVELAVLHNLGSPGPRFTNSIKRLRPILIRFIVFFLSLAPICELLICVRDEMS